jgi:hypothetical protein
MIMTEGAFAQESNLLIEYEQPTGTFDSYGCQRGVLNNMLSNYYPAFTLQ